MGGIVCSGRSGRWFAMWFATSLHGIAGIQRVAMADLL